MGKISALPAATNLTGDERLPVVQAGETKGATLSAFRDLIVPFLQAWYKGDKGDTGPAANTYTSYTALLASDPTRRYAYLSGDTDTPARPDGPYSNPTRQPGAWVRQSAMGISFLQRTAAKIFTRSLQDKVREMPTSVKDFGAIGDGVADDTIALQAAADYLAIMGGRLHLPPGVYKITDTVIFHGGKPQVISGCGKRKVYPGLFDPTAPTDLAVIWPVHNKRAAIGLTGSVVGDGTVEFRGIALATIESGLTPVAAFGIDAGREFLRDFAILECSIHGFTSAIDLYRTTGNNIEAGLMKVMRCNINRNSWIARTSEDTQWNGFLFHLNEAGQNGYMPGQGGIDIAGHNISIRDSCLEGMRDPIRLRGGYVSITVEDNYCEAVIGRAAIHLENIRGAWRIGVNALLAIDYGNLAHPVLLTNCGPGSCALPYRADGVHKTPLYLTGNAPQGDNIENPETGSDSDGWWRADSLNGQSWLREPEFKTIAKRRVTIGARAINPTTGTAMPVEEHTTAGRGGIALTYNLAGAAGDWLVLSWLVRRAASVDRNPYISIDINEAAGPGSRDYVIYNYDRSWRGGEWALITCAVKLGAAMTKFRVTLYPYNIDPAAGLVSHYLMPVAYTVDSPSKILPFVDQYTAHSAAFSPTAGTWQKGDRVLNANVGGTGQGTYVCAEAGTPGNWVFG